MRGVGAGWVVAVLGDSGGGEQLSYLAEVYGAPLGLVAFAIMQLLVVSVRRSAVSGCFPLFQAMRTLNWKYHLGLVSLDVELADRTLSLSVSPVHAAIILHFQTKSESCSRDHPSLCASCGWLQALRAPAAGPGPGFWAWIYHRAQPRSPALLREHPAAPQLNTQPLSGGHCTQLLAAGSGSKPHPLTKS